MRVEILEHPALVSAIDGVSDLWVICGLVTSVSFLFKKELCYYGKLVHMHFTTILDDTKRVLDSLLTYYQRGTMILIIGHLKKHQPSIFKISLKITNLKKIL